MPKQPHPKVKILYYVQKIDELLAVPFLHQDTEEQKIENMQWKRKLHSYEYFLNLWNNKLKQMYE